MKSRFPFFLLPAVILWSGCEPKPSAENADDREREIQARVAERLADERRSEQDRKLAAREQELAEREKDLDASEAKRTRRPEADEPPVEAPRERDEAPIATRTAASSYDVFYRSLNDYGDWIELGNYGYVFHPAVASSSNWRPYTNGYWAYSDYGWTWISNEPFGWATFHYGRWMRARGIGWVWVPGEEWAPAWVSWRSSDDYVGWAPLPPAAEYDDRAGIGAWADSTYDIAPTQYNFVTVNNFSSPVLLQNLIAPQENITIVNRTVNVTNIKTKNAFVVNEGPNVNVIRSRSSRPLQQFRIERNAEGRAGTAVVSGDRIQISAPVIRRASAAAEPPRVKERVKNVELETGWSGIGDENTAREVRRKFHQDARASVPSPRAPMAEEPAPAVEKSRRDRERPEMAIQPSASATATPFAAPSNAARPQRRPEVSAATPAEIPAPTPRQGQTQAPAAVILPEESPSPSPAFPMAKPTRDRDRREQNVQPAPLPTQIPAATPKIPARPLPRFDAATPAPTETPTPTPALPMQPPRRTQAPAIPPDSVPAVEQQLRRQQKAAEAESKKEKKAAKQQARDESR